MVNKADREGALRMKTELQAMLQLRPSAGWEVPVLLTEASHDRGIDELVDAVRAHGEHLAAHGSNSSGAELHREKEFLEVLDGELRARLERWMATDPAGIVSRIRGGEIDPYSGALEVLRDPDALRRLFGKS